MSLWIAGSFWSRRFSFCFRAIRRRRLWRCRPSLAIVWIFHSHLLAAASSHTRQPIAFHSCFALDCRAEQSSAKAVVQLISRALFQPGRSLQEHLAAPLECCFPGFNHTIPDQWPSHTILFFNLSYHTILQYARPVSNNIFYIYHTLPIASCYTIPHNTGP